MFFCTSSVQKLKTSLLLHSDIATKGSKLTWTFSWEIKSYRSLKLSDLELIKQMRQNKANNDISYFLHTVYSLKDISDPVMRDILHI